MVPGHFRRPHSTGAAGIRRNRLRCGTPVRAVEKDTGGGERKEEKIRERQYGFFITFTVKTAAA